MSERDILYFAFSNIFWCNPSGPPITKVISVKGVINSEKAVEENFFPRSSNAIIFFVFNFSNVVKIFSASLSLICSLLLFYQNFLHGFRGY